jgi:hypothetical protein
MTNQLNRRARQAFVALILAGLLFVGTACVGPGRRPLPSPLPAPTSTTVTGHVTFRDSGAPYPGAIVEFRNVYRAELHTTTDSNGAYSIDLPAGIYNAFALDLKDLNAAFRIFGRSDSIVKVPPSATVDFVSFPISSCPGYVCD